MARKSRVLVSVNQEIMGKLEARAAETGNPVTVILREAIYKYLGESRTAQDSQSARGAIIEAPAPASGAPPPGDRHRELEWRRTHADLLKQYAGQWVVVEGQELVDHGKDATSVVAEARRRGIVVPYIFRVEQEYGDEVVRFGL
ncbi:MAG: ribbon-helix-helix domain-containing protein [Armatimonadetes bacterium]|nr:ribbon-helix-helix domain-containing protein [Armatimonadota bacterium]